MGERERGRTETVKDGVERADEGKNNGEENTSLKTVDKNGEN